MPDKQKLKEPVQISPPDDEGQYIAGLLDPQAAHASGEGRKSRILSRSGSAQLSRNTSPVFLPTEVQLKAQLARVEILKEILEVVSQEELTLEELNEYKAQRIFTALKREIARCKARLTLAPLDHGSTSIRVDTKLPDISLPVFKGEYAQWPTFIELFQSLILDNTQLSNVQKLHYLRGCLKGQPAQLVSTLPLTGCSLEQLLKILTLMELTPFTQRSATGLNKLINTYADVTKGLDTLGVLRSNLGDVLLVYLAYKILDRSTREAWETSLGSSQDYPTFSQLEEFLTSRARALERIETVHPSSSATKSAQPSHSAPTKKASAHTAAMQSTATALSKTTSFA
ncbi:uncharacterized protein LOC109861830 [Pseudomyrmex gracilis]|uniref:uncharacterized protein LOC109861830 n=1 Tax=Pseudomyrmex gracilis TaxID=219809 RepID=UPI0009949CD4|nr:uncharacterized protein LOC109861830 [Pseudomyrmex gracilis]